MESAEIVVNIIHNIMLADCRMKIREISDIVIMRIERVQNILYDKLEMRKLWARIVDETWIQHYMPKMREWLI